MRVAWWFAAWLGGVLGPGLALVAGSTWVPMSAGVAMLIAGLGLLGWGSVSVRRRAVGGRADREYEPPVTVRGAAAAFGWALAWAVAPVAVTLGFDSIRPIRDDSADETPVSVVAESVLVLADVGLCVVVGFLVLYRTLRLVAVVAHVARPGRFGPPPGLEPGASGSYWVGVVAVLLFGALAVASVVVLASDLVGSWRYHHDSDRSSEPVRVVDIAHTDDGERLTTGDGATVLVAAVPGEWRLDPVEGLPATLEWYRGKVYRVSAAGVTRDTKDNPDDELAFFVPTVPTAVGLAWYAAAFAGYARRRRPVALAVVIGGLVALLVKAYATGLTLGPVLVVQGAATAVALGVLLARRRAGHARGDEPGP
ncbi:hypothetical protein [Dactylosporangium salmoneum]|uniref:hypothetical protein n=1 Tax=Dactylosporangium salmoneum TaxID=53361 RepID=UPI0031CF78E4